MSLKRHPTMSKCQGGFGLMEVIVSTGIIAFTFVGVMSLFAFNMRVEIMNRNRIVGAYLAQEAMEAIRQKRDANWRNGDDWRNGLGNGDHWVLSARDYNDPTQGWDLLPSTDESAYRYKQKIYLVNNMYVQDSSVNGGSSGWSDTGFRRIVKLSDVAGRAGKEMKVAVDIYYNNNLMLSLTSYLYNNWY